MEETVSKRKNIIIILGNILLFGIFLFIVIPISSAQAAKFIVSPPRFEFNMPVGSSTTEAIEVVNVDDTPVELRAYFMDWDMKKSGDMNYIKPGTLKTSCTSWMKVNPLLINLMPKESKIVRFTLTAPQGAAGSYWTVLFIESKPVAPPKGSAGVTISGRVGVVIYATIAGTELRSGKILDMKIQKDKENKYNLAVTFENIGNIHNRPKGTWELKNEAGKRVKKGEIEEFLVLPKVRRVKEQPLEEVITTAEGEKRQPITLPPGKYTLAVELDYGAKDLVGGDLVFEVPAPPAPKTPAPPPIPGK